MINHEAISKFNRLSTIKQKEMITDRIHVADIMRANLASDITNAKYGLRNVTRQMIDIEDYEETTARMQTILIGGV